MCIRDSLDGTGTRIAVALRVLVHALAGDATDHRTDRRGCVTRRAAADLAAQRRAEHATDDGRDGAACGRALLVAVIAIVAIAIWIAVAVIAAVRIAVAVTVAGIG